MRGGTRNHDGDDNNRPRLPLASDTEGMGDFAYKITPAARESSIFVDGALFIE